MAAGRHSLQRRELVARAPGPRMAILALAAGQEAPWRHWHPEVADALWRTDRLMVIGMRIPREVVELAPGPMQARPARRAHGPAGKDDGPCRFAILQGIGACDVQPVGG